MTLQVAKAVVIDYRREDGLTRAYHCPQCGYQYRAGRFGVEYEKFILCEIALHQCPQCEGAIFMPLLWNSLAEAEAHMASIDASQGLSEDAEHVHLALVPIHRLEVAYVDLHSGQKHLH